MSRQVYLKHRTQTEYIERGRFVGPMSEGQAVLKALHDDGWRTVRSGPYTDKQMHPRVDDSRFLFIMECDLEV